jgi:LysR family transcriptional regulator, transcriptional activator for bauABCD operon
MQVKNKALLGTPLGQLSDLDVRLLRVFKAVAECGGMMAAELELNIGGSTISRHVKDLETRLGLTLCRRGRAGFALTPEGERVYQDTLRLLAALDDFRSGVDDLHRRMGGQLVIALFDKTVSNPAARIAEGIARFSEIAPAVTLEVHVAPTNAIERGLIDGRFHVGVIPAHRASEGLIYQDLFDEQMFLYAAPVHPITQEPASRLSWETLRRYGYAGLGHHSPNMDLGHRQRLPRRATGFDQEAIATLILSGRYVGFLPDHYAAEFVRQGRLQAIKPKLFTYRAPFVAVHRRSPQASRAVRAFLQCLAEAHAETA